MRKAILDTNVIIAGGVPTKDFELAVASITYAELAYGVSVAPDAATRVIRGAELQRTRRLLGEGIPFDDEAAVSYGYITALVRAAGRNPRARVADLMIAAVAHANDAALITHNLADFAGLEDLIDVIPAAQSS